MLTLVDPELANAVAAVMDAPRHAGAPVALEAAGPVIVEDQPQPETKIVDGFIEMADGETPAPGQVSLEPAPATGEKGKPWKKRGTEKAAITMKAGEIVVGRRLYRSGQSEYLINGRVARLRDVQELFMGMGLGPDSYAIIEQGRIGQILNSKPMDRRAIIEEAAGITMYKTKRRLAEAKLEASKVNLSRVHDILVEVEKQLASLKRQASKARRYAELREQMRGLLRSVLASKAEHLDQEAVRLEKLLREMDAAEESEARSVHELESEQERLSARTYELDAELRQIQNLLGQTALDLDRAENRITFNREQTAQIDARAARLVIETEVAERQVGDMTTRMTAHREAVAGAARADELSVEASLRETNEQSGASILEQQQLDARMEELRQIAGRLVEESAREQAESLQAEEAAARHTAAEEQRTAAMRAVEIECGSAGREGCGGGRDVYFGGSQRAGIGRNGTRDAGAVGGIAPGKAGNRAATGAHARRAFGGARAARFDRADFERAGVHGGRGAETFQRERRAQRRYSGRRISRGGIAGGLRRSAGKVRRRDRTIFAR